MKNIILLSLLVLLIDGFFLYNIQNLFINQIMKVQNSNIKLKIVGFILSYVFIIIPLYFFIIRKNESLLHAFILGISIYGVYEYTNYALLTNWDFKTTIIDTLWGGILFVLVTYFYNKINKII